MRHPEKKRNISLVLTIIGGLIMLTGALLPQSIVGNSGRPFILCFSGMFTACCFIFFLIYRSAGIGYQKLLAGEGLLAQWMVDPQAWRDFAVYHESIAHHYPKHKNLLDLKKEPPAEGVEVVLSETGILVDGDYHDLPTGSSDLRFDWLGVVPGPPTHITMHITMTIRSRNGTIHTPYALRFPVPPASHEDAKEAIRKYGQILTARAQRSGPLVKRFPRPIRNGGLVIALLGSIALLIGVYCRNQSQWLTPDVAIGMAVIGGVVMVLALFIATMAHFHLRKQAKQLASQQAAIAPPTPPVA